VPARTRPAEGSAVSATLTKAREALAVALISPAPKPLFGTASCPGFFTGSSQSVKAVAELCQQRGWLEPTGESAGTGKSAKPLYRLTAAGAREVLSGLNEPTLAAFRSALEQVRAGLAALRALETAVAPLLAAVEQLEAPRPAVPSAPAPPVREVLRRQYDYLCRLIEFQDRLVELPRLYQKAREELPALTVQQFHEELLALERERSIELYLLNEVRNAARPELGIRRDGNLYYFVLWRKPR
jgi:hypothetical protein